MRCGPEIQCPAGGGTYDGHIAAQILARAEVPRSEQGVETRYRARAMASNGAVVWQAWFDRREDRDRFLRALQARDCEPSGAEVAFALDCGTFTPEIWRLPTPAWHPGLWEDLNYEFATVTFLTSPTGSNQTFNVPADWNSTNNKIECVGAGGGGGGAISGGGSGGGTGGGGGAYAIVSNLTLTPGGTATYQIGTGGIGNSGAAGNAGGNTWFNGTASGSGQNSVEAAGGGAGQLNTVSLSGGLGGTVVNGSGNAGGRGGNQGGTLGGDFRGGCGGGGSGGPSGVGQRGGDHDASPAAIGGSGGGGSNGPSATQGVDKTSGTAGANGGDGTAGTGHGVANSGAGTAGTGGGGAGGLATNNPASGGNGATGIDFDSSHGCGGGGGGTGGCTAGSSNAGGAGGLYGGGGGGTGGSSTANATGGAGAQGIIVVTYVPFIFFGAIDNQSNAVPYRRNVRGFRGTDFGNHGDDGIEAPFNFVAPTVFKEGWQVQAVQPPNPRYNIRYAGALDSDASDINDQGPIVQFFPMGWEVQPPQPPARNSSVPAIRGAATMRGDEGTEAPFVRFFPLGFPIQPHQPQHQMPERRAAAIMRGDDGAEATEIKFFPMGWEVAPHQPQHLRFEQRAGAIMRGDDGNQGLFTLSTIFTFWGWDVQPPQPPRQPPTRLGGAVLKGIDGIDAQFFAIFDRFDFGPESLQLPRRPLDRMRAAALMRGLDGIEQPFFAARFGFDLVPPTLLRRRYVSLDVGEGGIEAPFPPAVWGWEVRQADPYKRRLQPVLPESTLVVSPSVKIDAADWMLDFTEFLRFRRPEPATEAEPFWPPLIRPVWGYEAQNLTLRRRPLTSIPFAHDGEIEVTIRPNWVPDQTPFTPQSRPRRYRLVNDRLELITSFPPVWTAGWEVQAVQPPRPRWPRSAAIVRGIDGTDFPRIVPVFDGWDPTLFWPPHPRPERAAAFMQGDLSGAWGIFSYTVPSGAIALTTPVWIAVPYHIGLAP